MRFATKGRLAKNMMERVFEAGVPARWVLADSIYGTDSKLRAWLEERGKYYVLAVHKSTGVWHAGRRYQAVTLAEKLPESSWVRASAGQGSKGERLYDCACLELEDELEKSGMSRWLLVRRDIYEPAEQSCYLAYAPARTSVEELARTAGRRWRTEETFEHAKGETGLDEYEVRKWDGWYRHVTLSMLAYAYLSVLRSVAGDEQEDTGKKGS